MTLHYGKTPELEYKSKQIFRTYPKISQFCQDSIIANEDKKVEKSLTKLVSSGKEEKRLYVVEMLKNIDLKQFSGSKDKINISTDVMQHMTNITIFEFIQAEKYSEAISFIRRDNLLPSRNLIEILVLNLCETGKIPTYTF